MIVFVVGTRPDIIKMAPVIRRTPNAVVLHTNQHFSDQMDRDLCQELGIKINHRIPLHGEFHARGVTQVEDGLSTWLSEQKKTGLVVVYGDTLSSMAATIAAKKSGWKVAHVEAGLRSFDMTMPEEVARITIDALSDRLYAPTNLQAGYLHKEGIAGHKVKVLGNVIVEAVRESMGRADAFASDLIGMDMHRSVYLTLHRPENVDFDITLQACLEMVVVLAEAARVSDIYLPAHPRAHERLERVSLRVEGEVNLHIIDPMPYYQSLGFLMASALVVTDSGGIQEECAVLGRKCITVRKSTERQETISAGFNTLASPVSTPSYQALGRAIHHIHSPTPEKSNLYGEQPAADIAEDLINWRNWYG